MGDVVKGNFGPQPPAVGAPEQALPPPGALMDQLNVVMGFTRKATGRLTNAVPPGAAEEAQLTALFATHVTIQDNIGVLVKRINDAAGAGPDIAEGTYLDIAKDTNDVEQQAQAYIEAVNEAVTNGNGAPQPNAQLAPAGRTMMSLGQTNGAGRPWLLYGALAVGVGAVVWGVTQMNKAAK